MIHNEHYARMFWYWIGEREQIRLLRESGQARPWTKDPVMSYYHFCNVRREDDRGTKEIRAAVQATGLSVENLPWLYTMARLFNKAETLTMAIECGKEEMKLRHAAGEKMFHTAYLVSTCGKRMNKIDYVFEQAEKVRRLNIPRVGLEDAHGTIIAVSGLGSFLSAQIVADLRNDRYLSPKDELEGNLWSAWGPGSKKGLDIIFGPGTSEKTYPERMMRLRGMMPTHIADMGIHSQDLQNCLCEFSKYVRYLENRGGRSRPY